MNFGNFIFRVCWIINYTTRSCEELKFAMRINGGVDGQELAGFKVIIDLFVFCFYFIQ